MAMRLWRTAMQPVNGKGYTGGWAWLRGRGAVRRGAETTKAVDTCGDADIDRPY